MSQEVTENRVGYLVKRVAQSFRRSADERLRPLGLSMPQYAVLRALAEVPGAPAAELARRTFVTRQSLRDVLNGLRKAGLVSVASEPMARRALPVTLTDEGRSALERAEAIVTDVEHRMITDLKPADVTRLATLLAACADNLG